MSDTPASQITANPGDPIYQYGKFHSCSVQLEPQGKPRYATSSPPGTPSRDGSLLGHRITTDGAQDLEMIDAYEAGPQQDDLDNEPQELADHASNDSTESIVITGWTVTIPDDANNTAKPPSLGSLDRDDRVECKDLHSLISSVTLSDGRVINPFKIDVIDDASKTVDPVTNAVETLAQYYCRFDTSDFIVTDRVAITEQGAEWRAILRDGSYGPVAELRERGVYAPGMEWYRDAKTGIPSIGIDVSDMPVESGETLQTELTWFVPAATGDQSSAVGAV